LAALDEIVEAADAIMVARGDLGVETDLAEIPLVQKRIIAAANAKARPVVTATQMLESMVEHEHPTRAEVTDIANAVLDGTDAVMLSAESAIGRNPVAAVRILQRVIAATEGAYAARTAQDRLRTSDVVPLDAAVGFAACQLAEQLDARAIIAHVQTLPQAAAIARFRPQAPIVALTESATVRRSFTLVAGVAPVCVPSHADAQARITRARDWLYLHALARPGDQVVVLSASAGVGETADTLQVLRLP
jgi:pyruvate kinase